jgi:hypothetical protein
MVKLSVKGSIWEYSLSMGFDRNILIEVGAFCAFLKKYLPSPKGRERCSNFVPEEMWVLEGFS